MDIIDYYKWRYATKKFDPNKKIPISEIEIIKESIRLAPTSYGLQLFKVIIIENQLKKEELRSKRFLMALAEYGIDDKDLAEQFGLAYIKKSPLQTSLFPFSHEVLSYLETKYTLHIITNGFEEVQHSKLVAADLKQYFDVVVTSEKVGVKKPNAKYLNLHLNKHFL